jgi:hypothetical protein
MNLKLLFSYLSIGAVIALVVPSASRAQEGRERALLSRFDRDGDKKLNAAERAAALNTMGGGRSRSFFGQTQGAKVTPASVRSVPATVHLYDPGTIRTLFFEFEDSSWERELMAFKETDIEVPATLTVDGKVYKEVGVKFRGNSSFSMVPEGQKHSLAVSMDSFVKDQTLLGYSKLNLLNSHADPSFLHAVLFLQAAREYMPAAKANYVRVVINGESWGIYPNVEQFNKTFLKEWYKADTGARWKAPGSLNGRAGLEYWGEDPARYKYVYEIKSKDEPKAWTALVELTRILNTTPPAQLEAALSRVLDIDGALRFIALDFTFTNNDGYWTRASDYNLYLDPAGKFHIVINDVNEAFGGVGGGFATNGGPYGPADPLVGLNDPSKPLRSKLLAVPALRAKYLAYTKEMATKWLDWKVLEPVITKYQGMIAADVKTDTRKIYSYGEFEEGPILLKQLVDRRRMMILNYVPR